MSSPMPGTSQRWLFGPVPDLLFGCGLVYGAVFLALSVAGESFRAALPYTVVLLPISAIASAHYGATALRAYGRAEDRRAWALYSVWTTLLLGAGFAAGLRWEVVGSWFITLYLTWSPWHYAGQNFGVAMTFLRRRGVDVTPRARYLLHRSFVLSYVLALLALHGQSPLASYAPNELDAGGFAFVPFGPLLGLPVGISEGLFVVAALLYIGTTVGGLALLKRSAAWRDLGPTVALVAMQALWFSAPALARQFGVLTGLEPLSIEHAHYAFLWIGAGHALQYLWITAYFARAQGRSGNHGAFLLKALLAGYALWFVPAAVFAPGMLGRLPYDEGLAAMVAALVNLHHFMLDGVIWKLREGRIAQFLIGRRRESDAGATDVVSSGPARALLWAGGFLCLGLALLSALAPNFGYQRALDRGDLEAAEHSDALLDRFGFGSAERRLQLGQESLSRGELGRAERHLRRSVELLPKPWAWVGLGDVQARRDRWGAAADAYRNALDLDPNLAVALFHLGAVEGRRNNVQQARQLLARARTAALGQADAPPGLIEAIDQELHALAPR